MLLPVTGRIRNIFVASIKNIQIFIQNFLTERRGSIAITFGLTLAVLLGLSGMSVDGNRALNARTSIQGAADAAALAAVSDLEAEAAQQIEIAKKVFAANLTKSVSGVYSTPGVTVDGDIVTVAAAANLKTLMLGVINIPDVDVGASATAKRPRDVGSACVLALDRTQNQSLALDGSGTLSAIGCVVHSNSRSDTALSAGGTTNATADAHCAVGDYDGAGFVPTPYRKCMPVRDPLAKLAGPAVEGCDFMNKKFNSGTHIATPGTYCGGITFLALTDVTLEPGIYIVKDGRLRAHSNSTISGNGVVFYLTGNNAVLDIMSGSNIDLTAPTIDPYAGLVFIQDRNSSIGDTSKIAGGGTIHIVGGIYLPTQNLDIGGEGDISATSPFMPIIANNIKIHGNANVSIKINNTIVGMPDFLPTVWAGTPRLIN